MHLQDSKMDFASCYLTEFACYQAGFCDITTGMEANRRPLYKLRPADVMLKLEPSCAHTVK